MTKRKSKRKGRFSAQFEVRGEGYSPMELRTILDWNIYQLRSVPGVVEVYAFGGELKTCQLTLDPADRAARLRAD